MGIEQDIKTYYKQMYALALHLCRNTCDAEDIVQDVVCKALKAKEGYVDQGKGKSYLMLAVRNTFINDYRRKKSTGTVLEVEEAHYIPDPITVSHKHKRVIDKRIIAAINQLSPDIRFPFMLSNVYDYQYEEIAAITKAPMGTVRSRIHHAKMQLKSLLSQ